MQKSAFIKKLPNGKYRVLSQKGRNLGTFDSRSKAEKRLKQVEYFKYLSEHDENKAIDLTDITDFSYSAISRKLRHEYSREQFLKFLSIYKNHFDNAVNKGIQSPEKVALNKTIKELSERFNLKINKNMLKTAAISELGDYVTVGNYISNIIKFILMRLPEVNRSRALRSLKLKIYNMDELELSSKQMPAMASIGQCLTFIKHILFNHDATYIRAVLNQVVRNL